METGARTVRMATGLPRPVGTATRLVLEIQESIPVTQAEVELLLHWVGDLFTDLMNDGSDS